MLVRSRILFLLLLVAGCQSDVQEAEPDAFRIDNPFDGLWQDAPEVPFRFVLEQTFGSEDGPEEAMLGGVSGATTDRDGNVYIYDYQQEALISFDPNGDFRWAVGGPGQGPGEFYAAGVPFWNGSDRILIDNQSYTRIDVYDTRGRLVDSRFVEELGIPRGNIVGILSSTEIVLSQVVPQTVGANLHIVSLDSSWTIESTQSIAHPIEGKPAMPLTWMPRFGVVEEGLAVTYADQYRIDIRGPEGEVRRVITRAVDGLMRPVVRAIENGYAVTPVNVIYAPLTVSDEFRLVVAWWRDELPDLAQIESGTSDLPRGSGDRRSTLDLYDQDWRLLYAWTVAGDEEHGDLRQILHADENGNVYATMTNGTVGRFRLVVTPLVDA